MSAAGQALGAEAVVVRERRRERGRRDAGLRRDRDDAAPAVLRAGDGVAEVRGDDERDERGVVGVRLGDAVEEAGADDAAGAPDLRDVALVDVPAELLGARDDLVEALRVGDDLRRVERAAHVLDEGVGVGVGDLPVASAGPGRSADGLALRALGGEAAGEHGLGDAGRGHAEVEGVLHGPRAGALGAGLVEDDVDERLAGRGIRLAQHLGGDLDEVALELAGVPLGEDVGDLGGALAGALADQVVGLGDELHVGVLDAVVHHLHEVAGAVGADVGDARLAVGRDRRDRAQDRAEGLVRLGRAAGHDRRAVERALLAARDAHADEVDAGGADLLLAADGVVEVRVAAVDDDVARLEALDELGDDGVGALAGLHHDDRGAGLGERGDELVVALGGDEPGLGVLGRAACACARGSG